MKNSIISTFITIKSIQITANGMLNTLLFIIIAALFTACGNNAADYASEYGQGGKTLSEIDSISAAHSATTPLPVSHSPAEKPLPTLRQVPDTLVQLKSATQLVEETATNAKNETEAAILAAEQRLSDLRSGKISLSTPPRIPGIDTLTKPKSPALPIYKCKCLDVHIVIKNTTPSGIVAYYRGKYPKMTLSELTRINQPGILGISKFRPGTKICLKRQIH